MVMVTPSVELLRKAALRYARRGLPVFPCKERGKTPIVPHWREDATIDPEKINQWWESIPYNIAVVTGNGLTVVDIDIDHSRGKYGDETLGELEREYGPLPDTWEVETGGGGRHLYFRCDDPHLTVKAGFLPSLDYRALGGYVVAPPSIHESGKGYVWDGGHEPRDTELADLPEWLHKLMLAGQQAAENTKKEVPENIPSGERNDKLFRLASSFRAKGLTASEMLPTMLEINRTRCVPPLDDREILQICTSVKRYKIGEFLTSLPDFTYKPEHFTDLDNAIKFHGFCKDRFCHCNGLGGWMVWSGNRWMDGSATIETEAVRAFLDGMIQEAGSEVRKAGQVLNESEIAVRENRNERTERKLEEAKTAKKNAESYHSHALKSRNRVKHMLDRAIPYFSVGADLFDSDGFILNTPEGELDLRTGEILPHNPQHFCTKITRFSKGNEGKDLWVGHINTITCGDTALAESLQMEAGMMLYGQVFQECLLVAYNDGPKNINGSNGKSTHFNTLKSILGDYATTLDPEILIQTTANKKPALAELRGRRLVIFSELEENVRLSTAVLKRLASRDDVSAEKKYCAPISFKPTHTAVLFTNNLPRVNATDHGTWRRLRVIPFRAHFTEETAIPDYDKNLVTNAGPAALAWMIEGARKFREAGYKLPTPNAVKSASTQYRLSENWLAKFLNEVCSIDTSSLCPAHKLYETYLDWASGREGKPISEKAFSMRMKDEGYLSKPLKTGNFWIGIRLSKP